MDKARASCQDPPVRSHIQGDVIAERQLQRAAVLLCAVRWLYRMQEGWHQWMP